jgi:hypothetical protein
LLIPDIQHATAFLTTLGGPGAQFAFRTFDDRGDDFRLACSLFGDADWAVRLTGAKAGQRVRTMPFLMCMQKLGAGVFVTINETDGSGAKAEHIRRIRALIADADSAEQVTSLRRFITSTGLVPSMLVESGGLALGPDGALVPKLHAYWRMDGCPVDQFTAAQEILNSRTGCDPAVKDLPRVLRLPGFYNLKREPRMTRIADRGVYVA